jgi:hypothetical protein
MWCVHGCSSVWERISILRIFGGNASQVQGLTFRLPLLAADANEQAEIFVVSPKPIEKSDVWLVSDPLPYSRKPFNAEAN